MPGRITGWRPDLARRDSGLEPVLERSERSVDDDDVRRVPVVAPKVTPRFVDEAVESVLREMDVDVDTSQVMRDLLASDEQYGVAYHFYQDRAKERLDDSFGRVRKQQLVLHYVLSDDETSNLVQYAPEFDLVFRNDESHDHAAAAACRIIDHRLILSRLPSGLSMADVGGNPLFHIKQGLANRHVCNPMVDKKDPQRLTLRKLQARKLASSLSQPVAVRELAQKYIDGDTSFVCGKLAQDCSHKSRAITAIHVYDVPLQDWPDIMRSKDAGIVEGAMLFSPGFFEKSIGEMPVAGARYEIDFKADEIRVGFVDSPSWWYHHKWSEYMRYGVDQLIHTVHGVYSYKVVERRGDTLFFRILRVDPTAKVEFRQYYELPDVEVVEVKGFSLSQGRKAARALKPQTYHFPKPLWYDMVNYAEMEFERGTLDFGKLMNYYRTVAPRQTINATLVMGGYTVDVGELVPLVVHAGLAAAQAIFMAHRSTRAITDSVLHERLLADESMLYKVFSAMWDSMVSLVSIPLIPFSMLGGLIKLGHKAVLSAKVMSWAPVVRLVPVSVKHMLGKHVNVDQYCVAGEQLDVHSYADHVERVAPFDQILQATREPELATLMLDICRDMMPRDQVLALQSVAVRPKSDVIPTPPPSYKTDTVVGVDEVRKDDLHVARILAIKEAIEEAEMENRKLVESCQRAYSALTRQGLPQKSLLKKFSELHCNPDFWYLESGIVQHSALGLDAADFRHSAVYASRVDPVSGSRVMAIHDQVYEGPDRSGDFVTREYKVVSDNTYSGWVMTTDLLMVFNGPEILRSMNAALDVRHDYKVVMEEGPPGCGKTTAIVKSTGPHDCVMCPVRESITDTRAKILEKMPNFISPKLRIRTVDSYLVNYFSDIRTEAMQTSVLRADEAYMTHSGKWYAVAGLLGVDVVYAYGDSKQIPHIPRVQASKMFLRLESQENKFVPLTHRCPADAVAAWSHKYGDVVRTTSDVKVSMQQVNTTKGLEIPQGCVMMCMYQGDKKIIRDLYSSQMKSKRITVVTSHEAEGKTYEHVWLHRFDARKRTDDFSLFDKSEHVLVAMSRHRQTFKYVTPADVGDLVSTWMKSVNVRRIAVAMDVGTAGVSKKVQ